MRLINRHPDRPSRLLLVILPFALRAVRLLHGLGRAPGG